MFFFTWILAHTQDGERGRSVWVARSIQLKWSLSGGETPPKNGPTLEKTNCRKRGNWRDSWENPGCLTNNMYNQWDFQARVDWCFNLGALVCLVVWERNPQNKENPAFHIFSYSNVIFKCQKWEVLKSRSRVCISRHTNSIYLDPPRGAKGMVRGAIKQSFRVSTPPLGSLYIPHQIK